jgi:hypothetical protein
MVDQAAHPDRCCQSRLLLAEWETVRAQTVPNYPANFRDRPLEAGTLSGAHRRAAELVVNHLDVQPKVRSPYDEDRQTEPRMPSIQKLAKVGLVGVIKPATLALDDRIFAPDSVGEAGRAMSTELGGKSFEEKASQSPTVIDNTLHHTRRIVMIKTASLLSRRSSEGSIFVDEP